VQGTGKSITQTPSITNQLPSRYRSHKPVIAILVPKLVAWQRPLDTPSRLGFLLIAWPQKPTPRIKQQCVASYHTTKIIAHQRPKPVMANCGPKLVAMATSLSTCGLPSNTWFLGPIQAQNPNGISIGSAVFAQFITECLYTLQWYSSFPLKTAPSHGGIWTPMYMVPRAHPSPNPNSISIGPAAFCRAHKCDR